MFQCGLSHREKRRRIQKQNDIPRRRRRLRPPGDASDQRTQDQHVVCVICSARSWQTQRPNIGWPPFDLVLAVSLRGSRMTTQNCMVDELAPSTRTLEFGSMLSHMYFFVYSLSSSSSFPDSDSTCRTSRSPQDRIRHRGRGRFPEVVARH